MPPDRGPGRGTLPRGSFAAATWTIPQDHGGMTAALLRRSRMFAERGGVHVRILTFAPELDVPSARAALEARGELGPGVTLHNIWEDLRTLSDDDVGASESAQPQPLPRAERPDEFVRTVAHEQGHHETLHFRADGTLAVADRRSAARRRVTLYTHDGRPGRHWDSVWSAYRYWMRSVLPEGPSFVVVDSKSLVPFFARLEVSQVRTVHVVHGSHLVREAADHQGEVHASRRTMVQDFDRFDAVVFLTESQRTDVLRRIGDRGHAYVVPNSTELPEAPAEHDRDPLAGAVLASLTGRKRVGDAITGVRLAAATTGLPVRLDVYGDGPGRERLEARARRTEGVTLHGHVAGAASRLEDASFLLLTSRSEGLPLVFAEAMSRGCLPIAYDIRYGPADIITDGVDGFLVADGDTDGLARAIARVVTMDAARLRSMRTAARATAERYSDAAVFARWSDLFRDLSADGPRRRPARHLPSTVRETAGMIPRAWRAMRRAR